MDYLRFLSLVFRVSFKIALVMYRDRKKADANNARRPFPRYRASYFSLDLVFATSLLSEGWQSLASAKP